MPLLVNGFVAGALRVTHDDEVGPPSRFQATEVNKKYLILLLTFGILVVRQFQI